MALENESMRANLLNPPEMMNLGHASVGWSLCGLMRTQRQIYLNVEQIKWLLSQIILTL